LNKPYSYIFGYLPSNTGPSPPTPVIFDPKATNQQSFQDMSMEELRMDFRTPAALEFCGFTYKEACGVLNRYYGAWNSPLHGHEDLQ
jgi:hypothetical protein